MKRWIHAETDPLTGEVFLEDHIELTIPLPLSVNVSSSKDYKLRFDKWSTVDNFRKEAVELLTK